MGARRPRTRLVVPHGVASPFRIRSGDGAEHLVTLSGPRVLRLTVRPSGTRTLDLSRLPMGRYLMTADPGGRIGTLRIVGAP